MSVAYIQTGFNFSGSEAPRVEAISAQLAYHYLEEGHYIGTVPSISYAFGLWRGSELEGVCCFGSPAGAPQRLICGADWAPHVLELNRLFLVRNIPHDASRLVGAALRALPKPSIVLSYADPSAGHSGTIYQACNFIYCGLTEKRTNWTLSGSEKHGVTIADEFRGIGVGRAAAIRAKYGDQFSLQPRPRKHRYVFVRAGHKDKRAIIAALHFAPQEYPRAAA